MKFTNIFLTVMLCASFGHIFASSAGGGASKSAGSPTTTFLLTGKKLSGDFKAFLRQEYDREKSDFVFDLKGENAKNLKNNPQNMQAFRKLIKSFHQQNPGKIVYHVPTVANSQNSGVKRDDVKRSATAMPWEAQKPKNMPGQDPQLTPLQALQEQRKRQEAARAAAIARLKKEREELVEFSPQNK